MQGEFMSKTASRVWYQSYVNREVAETYISELQSYLDSIAAAGSEVVVKEMTPPDSLAHPVMEQRCARFVVKNAITAEREGYDAFVVGHMQDAGLYEARSVVDIPVIGLGEASMLYACTLGQRIAIVTINDKYIPWFQQQVRKYELDKRITNIQALSYEPGEITQAFDSAKLYEDVKTRFVEQCEPAVKANCDVIIPGGGIPMLLFCRESGFVVGGAPVLNGISVAVKWAEMAISLQQSTGVHASRNSDFIKPPAEYIEEFLQTL